MIVLINPKFEENVAGALRACSAFCESELRWSGNRFSLDSRKGRIRREFRMRTYHDVIMRHMDRPLDAACGVPVAVELVDGAEDLTYFKHPKEATYVFGPEDGDIPPQILRCCHRFVRIPTRHCINLSAAVNVVLADRVMKEQRCHCSAA